MFHMLQSWETVAWTSCDVSMAQQGRMSLVLASVEKRGETEKTTCLGRAANLEAVPFSREQGLVLLS